MRIIGYDLSDEVVLEIGKFAILWNNFEKDLFNFKFRASDLQFVCHAITFNLDLLEEFRIHLNSQYLYYNDDELFIKYFLYTENSDRCPKLWEKEYICDFLHNSGTDVDKFCGCILVIHRYRNNLMHGMKNVAGLEQQLQVFKIINEFLESIKRK